METETQETQVQEAEKVKVNIGKNGMKFIQGFGFSLNEFKDEKNNKELVKNYMLENYPSKTESIVKWLDWYKGYFNMGKIKGFNTDKSLNVKWNQ